MRPLRVSENIVPVSEFKAKAVDWLRRLAESSEPIVITQNGKAADVLLSPAVYDELTERFRFMKSVEEGLADVKAVGSSATRSYESISTPSSVSWKQNEAALVAASSVGSAGDRPGRGGVLARVLTCTPVTCWPKKAIESSWPISRPRGVASLPPEPPGRQQRGSIEGSLALRAVAGRETAISSTGRQVGQAKAPRRAIRRPL